jgi:hypothetical protein
MIGAATVLAWVALQKGATAGHGDARLGVGDGAIAHPQTVALICLIVMTYVAAISFAVFSARPDASRSCQRELVDRSRLAPVCGYWSPDLGRIVLSGLALTGLRLRWGVLATASITSGLWLALHLFDGLSRTALLLPMAIALPLARHYGGSLRATIIVHVCNNAAAVALPWIYLWLGWLAWP